MDYLELSIIYDMLSCGCDFLRIIYDTLVVNKLKTRIIDGNNFITIYHRRIPLSGENLMISDAEEALLELRPEPEVESENDGGVKYDKMIVSSIYEC